MRGCFGMGSSEFPTRTSDSRPAAALTYASKNSNSSLQPLFSSMRPTYTAKGPRILNLLRNRAGCGFEGTSEPIPTTTDGTLSLPETA